MTIQERGMEKGIKLTLSCWPSYDWLPILLGFILHYLLVIQKPDGM